MDTLKAILLPDIGDDTLAFVTDWLNNSLSEGVTVIEFHAVPTEHGIVYTAVEWGVQE